MTLFGQKKFGTFKFGRTVLSSPRYGFEVDWNSAGLFDGTNEGKNLQDLTIERGRQYTISASGDSFEVEDTGRFSAVLLDTERRYDPYNEASPLFGQLTGGKYFRSRVRTMSDQVLPLMAGMLDEPISYIERGMPMARFEGVDGWGFLRNQNNSVTLPLEENIYAEQAMAKVLEAASWPAVWGSDMNEGVDLRPYFWVDARSPAQVIHELAHNELGNVNMSAAGKLKFRSRNSLESEVLLLQDIDVINVKKMSPSEVIRNVITVESAPRSEGAVGVVWEIPGRLEIGAGETVSNVFAEFKNGDEVVPVKSPITPVSSTDFNATQNEDGSGADYTADISVSMYAFATRAVLGITNSGASAAWVYVRVRGTPLARGNSVSFGSRDEASIKQFGPRPFVFTIDQNVNVARVYRDLLANYFTAAKKYLIVDLMPEPDMQFAADLGQIIRVRLNNYGIDQAYRVIRITHKFADVAGIVVRTRWWLEPYIRLFSGLQVPFQVPFQVGSI